MNTFDPIATPNDLFVRRGGFVLPGEKPAVMEMLAQYGIKVEWKRIELYGTRTETQDDGMEGDAGCLGE